MIDQFFQDLFAPEPPEFGEGPNPLAGPGIGGGGGVPPVPTAQPDIISRLAGIGGGSAPGLPSSASPFAGGGDIVAGLPGQQPPAGDNVPLPRPRPDIGSILAGLGGGGAGGPGGPVPLPRPRPDMTSMLAGPNAQGAGGPPPMGGGGMPPGGAPQGNPLANMVAALAGRMQPGGGAMPTPTAGPQSPLDGIVAQLAGKRFQSALAGGFAGGNPAFKGGAFMKGAGGALTGGLKSDADDTKLATAAADKAQKQSNFARQQGDKEQTSAALRKLYGDRGTAATTNAAARAANPGGAGRTSWAKPPGERWKDANKLIMDFNKQAERSINPNAPDADAQRTQTQARKDQFKRDTLQKYGFDGNGEELPPPRAEVPSTDKVVGDREAKGLYDTAGTFDDPHTPTSMEDFANIQPGQYYTNPADGEVYVKSDGGQP